MNYIATVVSIATLISVSLSFSADAAECRYRGEGRRDNGCQQVVEYCRHRGEGRRDNGCKS